MNDAVQEENLIREALAKILEIRNIRNERRIQVSILNRSINLIVLKNTYFFIRQGMLVIKKQSDAVLS